MEEEKGKEEERDAQKREWWKKCQEVIISMSLMRTKNGEQEKESRRCARRPKARQTLGKLGSGSYSF